MASLTKSEKWCASTKHIAILLIGLCFLGLGLRLFGLLNESIWLDELNSIKLARQSLSALSLYLLKEDRHPPLYFMLLHFWIMGGENLAYLRLFSSLVGALTILSVYFLGKELFEHRVGLFAAILLAVSPLHIFYSQFARNYSLFILFTVLSFYCLLRATASNRWRWWALYVLFALASLFTHYFAIFALFAQNVSVLIFIFVRQ